MRLNTFSLIAFAALAACATPKNDIFGNPIEDQTDGSGDGTQAEADDSIVRSEAENTAVGNGFLRSFTYDEESDTFFVEGLAFDGNQPNGDEYERSNPPGTLGTFAVFEAPDTYPDSLTSTPIDQFLHRAIFKESDSGATEVAIVRTGGYLDFGFGGYIYQRNGGVVIPREGQATYTGEYAGIRDFDGRAGLEFVTGMANIDIDFSGFREACDPQCDNAIRGLIFDRRILDLNGVDITSQYVDALSAANDNVPLTVLPVFTYKVGPGAASSNGEASGEIFAQSPEADLGTGLLTGTYQSILAGNHSAGSGGEIVGVVVLSGDDLRFDGVTVRETGGFVVER